jgi:glutamine amidotransferase
MVAIIDYGMGNVASVQKALNFLNVKNEVTNDHEKIVAATSIVLPGVGSFSQGMQNLQERGLDTLLTQEVIEKNKPFLGICLGMQLLLAHGTEPSDCKGLAWIEGSVLKFQQAALRVPHMGWNTITVREHSFLYEQNKKDFYFIHSYHAVPVDPDVIAATVNYGFDVVAAIQKDNIFATQFHPEKSQTTGLAVLREFFLRHA